MQNILQKHEKENRMLAEQLVAFKQQIMESDDFSKGNSKYKGLRIGSFGTKYKATLYFTQEHSNEAEQADATYFLMMTYGNGNAVKVDISKLDEFFIVEGTQQICFEWREKRFLKSKRTETFESEYTNEIIDRYLELLKKNEDITNTNNHTTAEEQDNHINGENGKV